jgi:hypothetical protein
MRVDESHDLGKATPRVGEYEQMREAGLSLPGIVLAFQGDDDHARPAPSEILVVPFELT